MIMNFLVLFFLNWCVVYRCEAIKYWVIPQSNYSCPPMLSNVSKCLTLSDLISNASNISDRRLQVSTIYFLPGVHIPTKSGWLAANIIGNLSIEGDSNQLSVISCSEHKIGFLLDDIYFLTVNHLILKGCGYDSTDTPSGILEEYNYRKDSIMLNSVATLLLFNIRNLYASNLELTDNVGFGIIVLEPSNKVSVINSTICGRFLDYDTPNINRGNIFILLVWSMDVVFQNTELCNGSGSSEPLYWSGLRWQRYISGGVTIWLNYGHTVYLFFQNVTFRNNKAFKGGAIYLTSVHAVELSCQGDLIVHIRGCIFENNTALTVGGAIHRDYHFFVQCIGVSYTEYSGMYIDSSSFNHNSALIFGGGLHIEVNVTLENGQDDVTAFTFNITNSVFTFNRAVQGAALFLDMEMESKIYAELIPIGNNATLLTDVPFTLRQCNFDNNFASESGGAIYLKTVENSFDSLIRIILRIKESDFNLNSASEGSALFIDSRKESMSGASISVSECQFVKNFCTQVESHTSLSVIHLSQVQHLLLDETTIQNNFNCRAVYAMMSLVEIMGNVYIKNHSSSEGAAFHLDCSTLSSTHRTSQLMLNNNGNTTLNILHNHAALYGGGISVKTGCSDPELCFFKLEKKSDPHTAIVVMKGNTAEVGASSIYGGYLEHCVNENSVLRFENFDSVFKFRDYNTTPSVVASQPYKACICTEQPAFYYQCLFEFSVSVFPGQTIQIPLVGASDFNNSFPSVIRASIDSNYNFAELQDVQKTQQIGLLCKNLSYTISTTIQNVNISMTLKVDEAFGSDRAIADTRAAKVKVGIKECPFGFMLNDSSKGCSCVKHLETAAVECNIELIIIRKLSGLMWLGNYSGEISVHANCPLDYCKRDFFNVDPYNQQEQCNFNRSGVLCGACRRGLGLVLGTSQCKQCSNLYLLLLIVFALAGIGLVLILLKLDLTVSSGMLNGLIFYVNIIQANRSIYFPNLSATNSFSYCLAVVIAWLNLDLGVEVCLSSNLTQYSKTWLQFVFPIYIWLIVGTLIIVSRYSIAVSKFTGSSTVSVLATLFLLSYTKILRATLNSVSATVIQTSNGSHLVWLLDGSYSFIGWPHILLFLFALLMLLCYIFPVTFVLLLSSLLQAASNYKVMNWVNTVAPLIDAYQGPYKKKIRFWTGLMLLIRLLLFTAFAANILGNPELNIMLTILVSSALLGIWWRLGEVYKKGVNNYLEIFFLINLTCISTVTLYFNKQSENILAQEALVGIAVGSALTVLILIFLHKIFIQFSKTTIGKCVISKVKTSLNKRKNVEAATQEEVIEMPVVRRPTCTIVDIRENREPLI